ncbi:galactose ABC transporter substrate-binding protein [Clostridium chromiireducens]|uniref:D-galactose/methyl-galactoside binding periplasmic protein MglB n=1 Tax=Clostridium chromiireducens TaxID=225345 RepID=A0A1V4ILL8_9CLOT|nr:galactose ABC transporter substrate-binding protein [Clostridium chromiireducens]OPJ60912.1 D-galactose-binding periplasmic protein precursor [Clostridium chromiireducens]RII36299.1 galactose ABC transporter substrate-binding protein [Clostridium chromiireducens]
MFKKVLKFIGLFVIMVTIMLSYSENLAEADMRLTEGKIINVGVLLYRFDDDYISFVRQSLEKIQKENEGKVQFTFFDGKNQQSIQNKTLDVLLEKNNMDLLLVNLVDTNSTRDVINKIKEKNIPGILFNREPVSIEAIKSYNKSYYIGTEVAEAGVLQGKVITNAWNSNEPPIDKNNDGILQYIMLMGESDNLEAVTRTKYSILSINNSGIKTQELALKVCNWNKDEAKSATKALLSQLGNKVEAIIANNDSMAIGAIEALQEYGYNKGDKTQTITVVGVDAIPEAQKLIKEGIMAGSVLQDPDALAKALYKVGTNLVYNRNSLYDTEYKFDETGVSIRLPYKKYMPQ